MKMTKTLLIVFINGQRKLCSKCATLEIVIEMTIKKVKVKPKETEWKVRVAEIIQMTVHLTLCYHPEAARIWFYCKN